MKNQKESLSNLLYILIESESNSGKILVKHIKELGEDYPTNSEKLFEHVQFLASEFRNAKSEIINIMNKQVSDGINKLTQERSWTNLGAIAKHALEEEITVLKQEENLPSFVLEHVQQSLEFINLNHSDQKIALKMLKDLTNNLEQNIKV